MSTEKEAVGEYIRNLQGKGFQFKEDAIGFIYFGMDYANANEKLVKIAIEMTLKVQKRFDGGFYLSLLETLKSENIQDKREAYQFIKQKQLL
ncbi:DUF6123 family protein [Caldibacillus sp. 210928-DFI.2.22]|uniref:DUF6123 family protein n=1 Tax=unclassified Caldibacillus TaxID=2641266 RepID=UPI001D096F6B|nr:MULTISPECIES: DUF6123 family protein [unclassified Caldibacillus]MCB7070274.1 DUF6123 family protein [Caldibacillus sp. 210928-DFI.2.22]MCB7073766.1 DUF6123 family protein [Caldibacillus sp. 210928-DFI.2.18]